MNIKNTHLCLTCGGKKHTKYRAAGIKKATFWDALKAGTTTLADASLTGINGVLKGGLGLDLKLDKVIDPNYSSLMTTKRGKNAGKFYEDVNEFTTGMLDTTGQLAGNIGIQVLTAGLVKGKGVKKKEEELPIEDSPIEDIPIIPNINIPTNPANNIGYAQTGGNAKKIIPTEGGILKRLSSTAVVAQGNTHDDGGIMLDEETEVEDKEGVHNINGQPVISSDVLKNKETDNSFAKDMTKLEKEKGIYEGKLMNEFEKTSGKDNYNTLLYKKRIKQLDDNIKDLFLKQEEIAAKMGLRDNQGNPNQTSQDVVGDEQGIRELQNQVENQGDTNPQLQQEVPVNQRYGGIQINPKNKGKFTKKADAKDMTVQEFANEVMNNKEDYSTTTVKQANFAKNAKKFKHEHGGYIDEREQRLGYKDGSPYINKPYIDIYKKKGDKGIAITMQGVSNPLYVLTDKDDESILLPGKEYYFPNTDIIREKPIKLQAAGYRPFGSFNRPRLPQFPPLPPLPGYTPPQPSTTGNANNTPIPLTQAQLDEIAKLKEDAARQAAYFQGKDKVNDIVSAFSNFSNAFTKRAAPKALPVASNPYPNLIQAANRQFTQSLANAEAKSREDLANVMNRAIYSGNSSNPAITAQLTAANKANNEYLDKYGQNMFNSNTVMSQEELKKREADNVYNNMVYMNKANFANDMVQLRQDALAAQAKYMNDKLAKEKELVYINQMPVNQRNEFFNNVFGSRMRLGKSATGGKIKKKNFL